MMRTLSLALCATLAACAPQPPAAPALAQESLLPGSIGVLVRHSPAGLVVVALRPAGAAALAGVRAGDVLLRYNGTPVRDVRDFNRRVLDSPPGTLAPLDLLRGDDARRVELRVRELDTMPRV